MRKITLTRSPSPTDGGIPIQEWLDYLSRRSKPPQFYRAPPARGINPFTKQSVDFHPGPGSVSFDSTSGKCDIGHHQGTILASVPDDAAMEVIMKIAPDLGATVEDEPYSN